MSNSDKNKYDIENIKIIYPKFIDTCINLENRRQQINNWMISAILITSTLIFRINSPWIQSLFLIFISMLCFNMRNYVLYLKSIIRAKYKVIDDLEKHLGYGTNEKEWKSVESPKFYRC